VLFDNLWTTEWGYKGLGVMGAEFFGSEFVDDVLLVSSPPLGFGKAQG
jgi:hypothetical protein